MFRHVGATVLIVAAAGAWLLAACGDDTTTTTSPDTQPGGSAGSAGAAVVRERLDAIEAAIEDWSEAPTIAAAHMAAEAAHNLVGGTRTLGVGDRDGDGTIGGDVDRGLLPAEDGSAGLVAGLPGGCDLADVLGGEWSDPAGRWAIVQTAIDQWQPANNTFPDLPSHPQRIVGWATLTLASDDLDQAHEYASHARLHLDVTRDAIGNC